MMLTLSAGCVYGASCGIATGAPGTDWMGSITLGGQIEAGITGNPQSPSNGQNFGQLFEDKANHPILNQFALRAERDIDPKATGYDVGFKLEGLYGSDARIVHSLGLFDHAIHDRNQADLLEADVTLHTPWLFEGGVDLKAGLFPSPLGYEETDPSLNQFYSHSYIFYSLPYKHLGMLSTSHVSSILDVYLGIDSGSNTTVGSGDNNGRPAGVAGLQLTLDPLKILAITHIGPDDATRNTSFGNSAVRYLNDLVVTYTHSRALSVTTELAFVRDEGYRAEAYGLSQYISYILSSAWTLNGRAEVFRDNNNFFVANPTGNLDYTLAERGLPANFYTSQRPTTYSEITAGASYKPQGLPHAVKSLTIRPELRYDRALAGGRPFDGGKDPGSITLAADLVLGF